MKCEEQIDLETSLNNLIRESKLVVSRMEWLAKQVENDGNQSEWILSSVKNLRQEIEKNDK